jgi:DnaK suppressor protein
MGIPVESGQLTSVRRQLLERSEEIRSDIRRELEKYDQEKYGQLADALADPGERSVADLLTDLDLAEVSRDIDEFREIEAALLRIARGSYGVCIDCGEPIDAGRLANTPAAARCHSCQEVFENREQRERHRTL